MPRLLRGAMASLCGGLLLLELVATAAAAPTAGATSRPGEDPAPPWQARGHLQPRGMPSRGLALVDQGAWPDEPESLDPVDAPRLGRAFRELCGPALSRDRADSYARLFVEHGKAFGVDPFTLAAVAYRQSRGAPSPTDAHRGGLITVDWKEHQPFVRDRLYHYFVLEEGRWTPRTLDVSGFPFTATNLRRAAPSVYFAAALLRVSQEQCPHIDAPFRSVPHRSPVSHLVWGDAVEDAGPEERILIDRRRLIQYYQQRSPSPVGRLGELKLYCPLDGAPRKIVNGLGDVRGDGHHAHRGVDFESTRGEPVRSIAEGRVVYAGVGSRRLSPEQALHFPRRRMGRGGLFLLLQHAPEVVSAYMHLERYLVADGEEVQGGQLIGYVGRTGIKHDPAHLHFELRLHRRATDPTAPFGASVFPRDATFLGRSILAAQPGMWRRVRHHRWLRRQQAKRRAAPQAKTPAATASPVR